MQDRQYFNVSGRLVQGNVFEPQTTDMKGRPMTDLAGKAKVQYFMGVAVPKLNPDGSGTSNPDFDQAWANIHSVGTRDWPTGETQRPDFSWKIIDGDDPKHVGKEGFTGHYIFRFTSGFPWQAVDKGAVRPIVNPAEIKRGYYVRVFFTVAGNKNVQKPGVYLNGAIVELLAAGAEITSGPDANTVIQGAGAAPVIPGMQASPVAAPVGTPATPVAPVTPAPPAPAQTVIPPNPAILNPTVPTAATPGQLGVPAPGTPGYQQ